MRRWLASRVFFPLQERAKGHETLRMMREMEAADRMAPSELAELQRRRLRAFIASCYANVPHVRRVMDAAGVTPDQIREPSDLARLPLMTKADIRRHRDDLKARGAERLSPFTTGGSTGEPLVFDLGKRRVASRVACRQRVARWWGLGIGDSEVAIWGSSIELGRQDWVREMRDSLLASRLLSAFEMTEARLDDYLDVIRRARARQLFGYPSALYLLCLHAQKRGVDMTAVGIKAAFVTGEVLFPHQRELIARTLNCPVANGYGGRDSGFISHECPHGGMHLMADAVVTEIVGRNGRPVAAGETGEIVVTDLFSEEAPFIRYATGDYGIAASRACACGRPLPLLEHIEGRSNDLVVAPDGRLINALALVYPLREVEGIEQYRIRQLEPDVFHVQMACREDARSAAEQRITAGWQQLLRADVRVTFEYLPRIPPDPRGKFRHIVSEVAAARAAEPAGMLTADSGS